MSINETGTDEGGHDGACPSEFADRLSNSYSLFNETYCLSSG